MGKKMTKQVSHLVEENRNSSILVTNIKTAVRQAHGPERSRRAETKQKWLYKV